MTTLRMVVVLSLVSCWAARAEDIKTVSWLLAHPAELRSLLAECRDSPGEARTRPNCYNAEDAKMKADVQAVINSMPRR